jgi:hypothetical protein
MCLRLYLKQSFWASDSENFTGYNGALVGCALAVFQPALPFMPPALGALGPFRPRRGRGLRRSDAFPLDTSE